MYVLSVSVCVIRNIIIIHPRLLTGAIRSTFPNSVIEHGGSLLLLELLLVQPESSTPDSATAFLQLLLLLVIAVL